MRNRLLSRKLWVTILSVAALIVNKEYNQAVAVVMAYLAAQGYQDANK